MNEDRLKELLDAQFAGFFGQMSRHFDKRFAEVNTRFDAHDARFDRLESALDGIAKRLEIHEHERVAMNAQLDRHEGWIKQLAAKVGLRLSHDQR